MNLRLLGISKNLLLRSLLLIFCTLAQAQNNTNHHAIASSHPLATKAGIDILNQGGNAFDAAIAVTATLAVVEPTGSGLGGGGFWLLHRESDQHQVMIDGREKAPYAATRDMYLDEQGEVIKNLSIDGPLAAGIAGTPAALVLIAEKYGNLPLSQTLAPAIKLAKEGFSVNAHFARMAKFRLDVLRQFPSTAKIFLDNNEVPREGYLIKQVDLAHTLQQIATKGHAGFYQGDIAQKLVEGVRKSGGIWSLKDLKTYQAIERKPITGYYKGMKITSASPPSSGGIALVTMLNILSAYDLEKESSTQQTHLIVEAMRRTYRDRADYLGDADFTDIPLKRLLSPYYADGLRASIRKDRATPSTSLPSSNTRDGGSDTTHFSILDKGGNRVAATLSINYPFGSGFVVPGTGVLLNDEMDDFSAKPGTPNVYGLVGGEANAIEPGKRPLSSMSPTFIENDSRIAILGTPGGSRIISMVALAILNFSQGDDAASMVKTPRFHHQYLPDVVSYEPNTFSPDEIQQLEGLGHQLKDRGREYGDMQVIIAGKNKHQISGASDLRRGGLTKIQ
jgi:gamma-glutamyltranspeptidase/glutathione hydrolase